MRLNKNIIIIALVVLLGILITLLVIFKFNNNKISDLEMIKIKDFGNNTLLYLDNIDIDKDSYDSFILYSLEYTYNEKGINYVTYEDIKNIIESRFDVSVSVNKFDNVGITPLLFDNNVFHDIDGKKFIINKNVLTQSSIIKIPIITYELKDVVKKSNKFIATYDKYVVSNPYSILNYYDDMEDYDTKDILNYLTLNNGKITTLKNLVNSDNIHDIGTVDGSIKVTYIIKNDNLIIENIE